MGRGMGGWGRGNGITTSWMGGLNGAFTLFDDKMDLGSNYLYNGSDNFVEEHTYKVTYKDGGVRQLPNESGSNNSFTQGHRFGVRLEHKFSENTSILFEPQFNFGSGRFNEYSDFVTREQAADGSDPVKINEGWDRSQGWNNNWSTSGFLLFRQRLGKPGRTISANFRYSLSDNNLMGTNQSHTDFYVPSQNATPDVNQYFDQNSSSTSLTGRVVYTEPLGAPPRFMMPVEASQ